MRPIFIAALAYLVASRILELVISRRHERRLLQRGGRRIGRDGLGLLIVVHVGWILSLLGEELLAPHAATASVEIAPAVVFVVAELVRYSCMVSLGERWTAPVIVVDQPPVSSGPYRFTRHPNYLAVAASVAALPLALGLPFTTAIFTPLKILALARRVRIENRAVYG